MTKGNTEKRYVGSTDEKILDSEKEILKNISKNNDAILISSPLKRCRETCYYLTGREPDLICNGLREMDFGDFEYKNFAELDGNPDYQAYIDSNGEKAFPNGESKQEFTERTCKAFAELMRRRDIKNDERPLMFFVHGGTIMALLSEFGVPEKDYFSYQTKPLSGFTGILTDEADASMYAEKANIYGSAKANPDAEKSVKIDYNISITDITGFSLRE